MTTLDTMPGAMDRTAAFFYLELMECAIHSNEESMDFGARWNWLDLSSSTRLCDSEQVS